MNYLLYDVCRSSVYRQVKRLAVHLHREFTRNGLYRTSNRIIHANILPRQDWLLLEYICSFSKSTAFSYMLRNYKFVSFFLNTQHLAIC